MAANLLVRAIIEKAINKGIKDIEDNPKRGIRNLVDLGIHFAKGRFQKDILRIAQGMLTNLNSPYYKMVSDIVRNVDHNIIKKFGINIGYNSWTEGAKKIRKYEKEHGYNVPWVIVFDFQEKTQNKLSKDDILDIVSQGKRIGIYSYIFFINDNINDFVDIINNNGDCAFILYVPPKVLSKDNIHDIKSHGNTIFSILFDESDDINIFLKTIEMLRKDKCLFGVYRYYDDQNFDKILSDQWIRQIQQTGSIFAFFIKKEQCSSENSKLVYEHILSSRINQRYPLFLVDFYEDIAYIDRIISIESCFLGIKQNGDVVVLKNKKESKFNISNIPLTEILSKAMPGVNYL